MLDFFLYYNGVFLLLHKYIEALEDVVSSDYRTAERHDWHNGEWTASNPLCCRITAN